MCTTIRERSFPIAKTGVGLGLLHPRFTILELSACSQELRRINMNAQGDDHVSFSAAHLALQGQYLLVSTDGPRIIMYNITGEFLHSLGTPENCSVSRLTTASVQACLFHATRRDCPSVCAFWKDNTCPSDSRCVCNVDWQQKRNFFGLPVEKFHQPLALWHPSGHYIIAAAAHGYVYVFHVGSAKVPSCPLHAADCLASFLQQMGRL